MKGYCLVNSKLTTIYLIIKSIYNENYYNLTFGSTPRDTSIVTSIPQLFGYKKQIYTPSSVYSTTGFLPNSTTHYTVTSKNNTFKIVLYQGTMINSEISDYIDASSNVTISVTSTLLGIHSRDDIMNDINGKE